MPYVDTQSGQGMGDHGEVVKWLELVCARANEHLLVVLTFAHCSQLRAPLNLSPLGQVFPPLAPTPTPTPSHQIESLTKSKATREKRRSNPNMQK